MIGHVAASSVVQELDPLLAELRRAAGPSMKRDDLAQTAVDVRLVGADLAHAERRALPGSWSSHSAIDTLNFCCTRALIERSTLRLPLSEWFSGSGARAAGRRRPSARRRSRPMRSAACAPFAATARSRRATCSTSYASMTSPTLTSW